jgi:hypothetical protein
LLIFLDTAYQGMPSAFLGPGAVALHFCFIGFVTHVHRAIRFGGMHNRGVFSIGFESPFGAIEFSAHLLGTVIFFAVLANCGKTNKPTLAIGGGKFDT